MSGDSGAPSRAARRAADALIGLVIAERYRIERMVSIGAHTVITDATDTEVGRTVTLKLIRPEFSEDPDFRRRFDQTMRAMSALSHPNIAAIYDWGETVVSRRTTMFAVVEYLGGGSLRDLFDRGRWLSPSQALMVGLEACRALDYAHRRQIAHSEITPSKLVFGDDRRLRIVDFGLARLLGLAAWRDPATVASHTARYASPEQALGQPIDGKTDVYALALCMVEAVTGSVPFAADSTVATLSGRIGKLMPVSADLGSLASVLERAGRPEPADRWTAAQFGRALVQAATKLPRPEPLPLLTTSVFDERHLRRPTDPTGGIERPPDPVVVVPVSEPAAPAAAVPAGDDEAADQRAIDHDAGADAGVADDDAADHDAGVVEPAAASTFDEPVGAGSGVDEPGDEEPPETTGGVDGAAAPVDSPSGDAAGVDETSGVDESRSGDAAGVDETSGTDDEAAATAEPDEHRAGDVDAQGFVLGDVEGPTRPRLYDGADDLPPDDPADDPEGAVGGGVHGTDAVPPIAPPVVGEPVAAAAGPGGGAAPTTTSDDDGARRMWPRLVLAFVLIGALVALGYVAYDLLATPRHEVPDLTGSTEEEARAAVAEFDWKVEIAHERSDEVPEEGEIVRTSPEAGADLAEGDPILLVISEGPELRELPDLVEMTEAQARTALAKLDLKTSTTDPVFHEKVPKGAVVTWVVAGEPDLEAGDEVLPGTKIELTLSKGPKPRTVPDLIDVPIRDAREAVEDLQLRFERTKNDSFHNTIEKNHIIKQWPKPGEKLDRGGRVVVLVSKGPDYRKIPDLSGLNVNRAVAKLERAGFKRGKVMGVGNRGVFRNACVDGERVDAGDKFVKGTTVDLVFLTQDPRNQNGTVHCSGF